MRIGIVTFQQALNYGAFLQMYALQKYINDTFEGVDVEIIQYNSVYLEQVHSPKFKKGSTFLKTIILKLHAIIKDIKFTNAKKRYIKLSKQKYNENTIYKSNSNYDLFICGSDQIWNPSLTGNDLNYFLNFSESEKRNSYAASVGVDIFPSEIKNEIVDSLLNFRNISVRENGSKDTLVNSGINNRIFVNIDPTLLVSKKVWSNFTKKKGGKKYLFIYSIQKSIELIENAKKFANDNNLKILYVGPFIKDKAIKNIFCPSIEQLLTLFYNADYIFANSFHGTVFSIIFHKNFFSFLNYSDGRNNRIINLLDTLGLSEHLLISNVKKDTKWELVDEKLELLKKESYDYLRKVIYGK